MKQGARAVRQHARVRQGLLLPRRLAHEPRQEVRGLVDRGEKRDTGGPSGCTLPFVDIKTKVPYKRLNLNLTSTKCGVQPDGPPCREIKKRSSISDRKAILCTQTGEINPWGGCVLLKDRCELMLPLIFLKIPCWIHATSPWIFPQSAKRKKRPSKSMQQECLREQFYGRGIAGGIIQTRL